MSEPSMKLQLGELQKKVDRRLKAWMQDSFARRLFDRDPTLWSQEDVPELGNRLGWVELPFESSRIVAEVIDFVTDIRREGFTDVVVLGMGGSSLAPEVFQASFGNAPGYPRLTVLDSTHPQTVVGLESRLDLDKSLFVVSSKSGSTIETLSFFRYFWARLSAKTSSPGNHFIAITDPGSSLEALARERSFRTTFLAPEDVGGRYSALTAFGLVPAALIGVDIEALLRRSVDMASPANTNAGLVLGAVLGEASLAGRNKLTFLVDEQIASLPDWIEQLVAESTGKDGLGIVPVTGETVADAGSWGDDRLIVTIGVEGETAPFSPETFADHPVVNILVNDLLDLGREFYRWEIAVATAGSIMGVQPFDQPDVQLAKDFAKRAMAGESFESAPAIPVAAANLKAAIDEWAGAARAGSYVSVHVYLAPDKATDADVVLLTRALRQRTGLPVTTEYGPRFLHSTGQLHKGGPAAGLFLQIVDRPAAGLNVPETDFTFDHLISAQADGDAAALTDRGRNVIRIDVTGSGLDPLIDML